MPVLEKRGFSLLEALVALVILGLTVLAYLQLVTASTRSIQRAELWSRAVVYAENAMEALEIRGPAEERRTLEDGFEQAVEVRPLNGGLQMVTVTIYFPEGGRHTLSRLFEAP